MEFEDGHIDDFHIGCVLDMIGHHQAWVDEVNLVNELHFKNLLNEEMAQAPDEAQVGAVKAPSLPVDACQDDEIAVEDEEESQYQLIVAPAPVDTKVSCTPVLAHQDDEIAVEDEENNVEEKLRC